MKSFKLILSMAVLLVCGIASAGEETIKLPDTIMPALAEMNIQYVKFAPITVKAGHRVILKGRFFYHSPNGSGWNTAARFAVNTRTLRPLTADKQVRLLRRGAQAEFVNKTTRDWWDNRYGLLIFFGSDQGWMDKRVAPATAAEGNWYYLDITDCVTGKKENTLQIVNSMRAIGKNAAMLSKCALNCKDMEVFQMPEAEVNKLRPAASVKPGAAQAAAPAAPAQPLRTKSELLPNGDMLLPELQIYPRPSIVSDSIKFPALRRVEGKIPVLKADIFYNNSKPSGWNTASGIVLNSRQLTRYNAQGKERLLRRGTYMKTIYGKGEWWSNSGNLLIYFGPGSGEVDKRIHEPRAEGFTYYLDVADLLNYVELGLDDRIESDKENILQLNCGLTNNPKNGELGKAALTMKNARIIWMSADEIEKVRPAQPLLPIKPTAAVAEISNGAFKVTATKTGGIILERNGEKYFYSAAFSYPAKPVMKFDNLGVNDAQGSKDWQVQVKKSGNKIVISGQTARRKVQRTLEFTGKFLSISDAVTNLTKADMPLLSQYSVLSAKEIKPMELYLAGMQGITEETGCGSNPTLYVKGSKSGFGAMALEDAFRCHLELSRSGANQAIMKNPTALAPGETYVQQQLVMLTGKADYFEFINALRHHLKLNHTLEGPITLGGRVAPDAVQERIVMAKTQPQWFEYGGVASLRRPRSVYIEQYNASKADHTRKRPGCKVLAYTENSPATVDKSKIANKNLLPANPEKSLTGTYGQAISKEATKVLDNTPWHDSILRTADGRAIIDLYYAAGPDMLSLLVYPYKENHYKKVLFERTKFLLDEANVDGIYIDQFANGTMYPVERSRDRISFEKWDGRTVLLNSDGTIKSKLFDVGYACSKTRADYIRFVTSRGKFFLANTQPVTTTEAAAGGMRFYESDSENLSAMLTSTGKPTTFRLQAFSQLSPSPILLGCRPARFSPKRELWPKMYNRAFIGGLRHGLLYVHYGYSSALKCYGLVNHMFPLTPVELGEGFIIGKERIVTAVSRQFITSVEPKKIIGFDAEGKDLANVATVKKLAHNKFAVDVKLNDWNSSCVIVLEGYANAAEEQADYAKKKNE